MFEFPNVGGSEQEGSFTTSTSIISFGCFSKHFLQAGLHDLGKPFAEVLLIPKTF